jgi:hypothetical protein
MGITSAFASPFWGTTGGAFAGGFANGFGSAVYNGSNFGDALAFGAQSGAITATTAAAFYGIGKLTQNANVSARKLKSIAPRTRDNTGIYGKFTLSAERGGAGTGVGSSGHGWGHSWISIENNAGEITSHGFWPGDPAGKESMLGYYYPGLVSSNPGLLDIGISEANAKFTWLITETQYNNLGTYVNSFSTRNPTWSLNVNCTDFAVGAANAANIYIPNVTTLGHSDPNKLADFLEKLK